MKKQILYLVLLGLLCSIGNMWGQTLIEIDDMETTSGSGSSLTISGFSKGDCTISQSSEARTGSYSLKSEYSGTGDKTVKTTNTSISVAQNSYLHVIGYAKMESSDETAEGTSNQAAGNSYVGGNGKGTYVNLQADTWQQFTSAKRAGSNQNSCYVLLQRKHSAKKAVLFDDVVIYVSTNSTTDIIAPSAASSASATPTTISWTCGSDANTGIQNTLIWKRTNGSAEDLTINNQGKYAASNADQSGHWTLISASVAADAKSYSGTFKSGDVYAIVHRDLAYNYSSPTYVTIIDESADPEVTAVTINGEAISASDLATLTTEKEVTIDGSTMNGLGNIVLTMSKGDAPTITRNISSGVATYTYTLNVEEYTININYGERIFGDAEGSVVYYSKNSTTAAGVGTSSLTANDINFAYPSKTFGYGEGSVTIASDIYQPIKLSTGEAVTVTFPSGKKATKIIVYGWSSAGNGWLKTLSETSSENFIFNNVAAGSADLFYATNEATDIYPSVYEYDLTNYGGLWESAYFYGAATS